MSSQRVSLSVWYRTSSTDQQPTTLKCFVVPTAYTDQFKNSYCLKTITEWNQVNELQVQAETIGNSATYPVARLVNRSIVRTPQPPSTSPSHPVVDYSRFWLIMTRLSRSRRSRRDLSYIDLFTNNQMIAFSATVQIKFIANSGKLSILFQAQHSF